MSTALFNLAVLFLMIPVGLVVSFFILRGLDKLNDTSFKDEILPIMETNPLAVAIYYGIRFASVLYLIGVLCSRFI